MAATASEHIQKMEALEKEALTALESLRAIAKTLAPYHITKYSGVSFEFGDVMTLPLGLPPVDQAGMEAKRRLGELAGKYSRTFPREFMYLDPKKLYGFKCLPVKVILTSVDLMDSLNKTIVAMATCAAEIASKKAEMYRMAAEGPIKAATGAAFVSARNLRLLDSYTTDEQIQQDFENDLAERNLGIKGAIDAEVSANMGGKTAETEKRRDMRAMGLTTVPADPATKVLTDVNLWLFRKQYPRSTRVCRVSRTELTGENLSTARTEDAARVAELSKAGATGDKNVKGLGVQQVASPEMQRRINAIQEKLASLAATEGQTVSKPLENRLKSIVASLQGCETSDGVKVYVKELDKLSALVDATILRKASDGTSRRA